jgi:hypothetical protein
MSKLLFKLYSFFNRSSAVNQYYFFLPNIGNGFDSEIHITNYFQNTTSPALCNLSVCLYKFDFKDHCWELIDKLDFNEYGFLIISSRKYGKKIGDLVVASLHKQDEALRKFSDALPTSSVKKNDFSPHAVRCRLVFKKRGAVSSYMADYPKNMTYIQKGSAFSYGHLLSHQHKYGRTIVIFVSISNKNLSDHSTIKLFDVSSCKVIHAQKIISNKANFFLINNIHLHKKSIALITQGLSGIPIYLSEFVNKDGIVFLSCEHSHPPAEYFFSNSNQNQINLKKSWFEKLLKI